MTVTMNEKGVYSIPSERYPSIVCIPRSPALGRKVSSLSENLAKLGFAVKIISGSDFMQTKRGNM
jgi:hypothetical protein